MQLLKLQFHNSAIGKLAAINQHIHTGVCIRQEVCALDKRSVQSLDFTINRFFMKLFKTSSIVTVHDCQSFFGVDLPSIVLAKRFDKFVDRYGNTYI